MTVTPPEPIPGSILQDTKASLGLAVDYTPFDAELIMHINSVLAILNQLGVGPAGGMSIDGDTQTWDDFLIRVDESVADPRLNDVKSYVSMRVKMIFDPPNLGYVITSWEKVLEELTWRIMVANDDAVHPLPPPVIEQPSDLRGYEELILDGGAP